MMHIFRRDIAIELGKIAGIAVAYYAVGRLTLVMAIPPGYAVPVWPAAGLALGAAFLFGPRIWPGIWLGSFAANILTGFNPASFHSLMASLLPPMIIGAGASIQALAGAFSIKRWVSYPMSLDRSQDIIKAMAIGGPLCCLINATVGVFGLLFTGKIEIHEWMSNWSVWWVGDTLGSLFFIPLFSVWRSELANTRIETKFKVILPVAVGVLLTLVAFFYTRHKDWYDLNQAFIKRVDPMAHSVEDSIDREIGVLQSIRGLFYASELVERAEFRVFAAEALERLPSLQALEWIPKIQHADRSTYEAEARQAGYPQFQFTEKGPDGQLVEASRRDEYFPVYFVEPYNGNERALGFDLASNPQRHQALKLATDRGMPTATPRIELVKNNGQQFGVLLFVPIYRQGIKAESFQMRRQSLTGFALGVLRVGDLVERARAPFDQEGIICRLLDISAPTGERLLYVSDADAWGRKGEAAAGPSDRFLGMVQWQKEITAGGRMWVMEFYLRPSSMAPAYRSQAYTVIVVGLLFTSLLGAFLFLVAGQTEKSRQANLALKSQIAERVLAEDRIRMSERRFRELIESAPDVILMLDAKSRIRLINRRVEAIFGYNQDELLDQSHGILLPERFRKFHVRHIQNFLSDPKVRPMGIGMGPLVGLRKDGSEFPVEIGLSPLKTDDGLQVICTVRDVTHHQEYEQTIHKKAIELDAIYQLGRAVGASLSIDPVITAATDGIMAALKPDFSIIYLIEGDKLLPQTPQHAALDSHLDPDQIRRVGDCFCGLAAQQVAPIFSEDIHTDENCSWIECQRAGVLSFAALPLIGKEGLIGVLGMASRASRDFSNQAAYLETLTGQISLAMENAIFYQRIVRHATELEETVQRRTLELETAKDRAESADRLKSAFLASMSHELRTPLNSIIGFTGALLMGISGDMNAEQNKQLDMVQNSANHLLNLINDVLDLSKIESGQLEIHPTEFDFSEVLQKVIAMIGPLAEKKQLDLRVEASRALLRVNSDQKRVEQILINLINNAVKFTEAGRVIVKNRLDQSHLILSVTDTGIGIAPEDIRNIFKAFRQADTGLARKYEGTGLGLSICVKLAHMLNGTIRAESPGIGKGSTFIFTLPLQSKGQADENQCTDYRG